ncbi:hypothetical protein HK097_009072 [Rhizophlyctis rosea]|uniref:Uncharacterized protein n=1 Tax=Rhizophlyctis rosea TaxID=64517 RepID=A0AAD5SB21_9FUNG|nr:hypothetical protein HK097_009072 [Rhizophlyctis rosea]
MTPPWKQPQPAPPPSDPDRRTTIDKIADSVARNGPGIVEMVKTNQRGNPKFEFLWDGGEDNAYFEWRVFELQNPAAAAATLASIHVPPPTPATVPSFPVQLQQSSLPAVPASFANPLLPALAALTQVQHLKPPVQFPPVVEEVLPVSNARQALIVALNGQEQAVEDFANILEKVMSDGSQSNIMLAKSSIFELCSDEAKLSAIVQFLQSVAASQDPFERRLHILYILNDLIFHCERSSKTERKWIKNALVNHLTPMLRTVFVAAKGDGPKEHKLTKVLKIWETKNLFSKDMIESFRNRMQVLPPAAVAMVPDVASVMSAIALQNALQQTALQTALLQQQQQQQHQQFLPMQIPTHVSPPIPAPSNPTPMSFKLADPRIKQEPHTPPAALSSFVGAPAAPEQNGNTKSQKPGSAPITFTMKHVAPATRPHQPISMTPTAKASVAANVKSEPVMREEPSDEPVSLSTPQPQLKHYELPAGLMVSACSLSDAPYTPILPERIKPLPEKPTETPELVQAVEEYYQGIGVIVARFGKGKAADVKKEDHAGKKELQIDSDGWEAGYLDEWYKLVEQAERKRARRGSQRRDDDEDDAELYQSSSIRKRGRSASPKRKAGKWDKKPARKESASRSGNSSSSSRSRSRDRSRKHKRRRRSTSSSSSSSSSSSGSSSSRSRSSSSRRSDRNRERRRSSGSGRRSRKSREHRSPGRESRRSRSPPSRRGSGGSRREDYGRSDRGGDRSVGHRKQGWGEEQRLNPHGHGMSESIHVGRHGGAHAGLGSGGGRDDPFDDFRRQQSYTYSREGPPVARAGSAACFRCGKPGHIARDCDDYVDRR